MRKLVPGIGAVLYAAALVAPSSAQAARATECTAINICYCVEQDLKGAIDTNVSKVRQAIAEQKSAGKAVGYLSIPISTVGGAYYWVNVDVAAKTKAAGADGGSEAEVLPARLQFWENQLATVHSAAWRPTWRPKVWRSRSFSRSSATM